MPKVERTVTVAAPMAAVVEYLKDFGHAEEWDPGTQSCTRQDSGPIVEGSRWRNVSKFAGRKTELAYTLRVAEPTRLTFIGENKTATSIDDMTFTELAGGTRLTYQADIRFHGLAKLAGPLFGPTFKQLGDETASQLTVVLNRLAE